MGQVDALKMVEHLRTRLVDLAVSENYVRDQQLSDAARDIWEGRGADGGLVSELWVEGAFPGELSGDSLRSLSDEGLFPPDLCLHVDARDAFPEDRLLYNHQSEVLRRSSAAKAGEKLAFVITAGTGLGKTEAFLLPVLKDLWTAPARRKNGGTRCVILYPMNALVADQIDRIYKWLQGQHRLSAFHFTSETPENAGIADKRGEPTWEPCRARTRQEARGLETHDGRAICGEPLGDVPDIVITNYSMLEYMLCRPQDSRFFGPDLRCIILDEAHLYSGALAAEMTMLLRRVRERCGVTPHDILHIAASATLGGDDQNLRCFASSLFSTDEASTVVVRGLYAKHDLGVTESPPEQPAAAAELARAAKDEIETLTEESLLVEGNEQAVEALGGVASLLASSAAVRRARREYPGTPARFLHATLREAPLTRRMASILTVERRNVLSLEDLASRLFEGRCDEDERNATILLLRLAAAARLRASDLPLVPHRLHLLVRAPEGLAICLNPRCSGPERRRLQPIGCLQPLGDRCQYCRHILLPIHRCDNCGEWALAAHENTQTATLRPGYYAEAVDDQTFYLLSRPRDLNLEEVVVDSEVGEIRGHGAEGVSLWRAPREGGRSLRQLCPTCHSLWAATEDEDEQPEWRRTCRPLVGGRPFALSVTAETVLHDLPPYARPSQHWKPARGRRLLSFSDSRAYAARLGPLLTQQHEMQVVRAAMARGALSLAPKDAAGYLAAEVHRLEKQIREAKHDDALTHFLESELREKRTKLQQAMAGVSFVDFAEVVARRREAAEILDREAAERHNARSYGQTDWERNTQRVTEHAQGLIAKELQRPLKKRASVESVGALEVVFPGLDRLPIPPLVEEKLPSDVRPRMAGIWTDLVSLLLEDVRKDGCVDWSLDTPGRTWLGESPLPGRWLTRRHGGWRARAFVGAGMGQLRRRFVANVLRSSGCDNEVLEILSDAVLSAVFDQLSSSAGGDGSGFAWLRKEEHHQTGPEESDSAVQILLDQLSVRAPARLYRCNATGTVWTHCALGWAPIDGCLGTLCPATPEELDKDRRWGRARREFRESQIFAEGLWAEEHSAQLSPQENRRLQDLFREGIRNVLSSTTTMELGIDIGGLNGVLLANVPPGPANHRQRAGRAGRRSDGSAVVVTYARDSAYDREVFHRFGDFLKRELRKPTVFLDRDRIIRRHLNAVLLSDFLHSKQPEKTGAMHAFGRMGEFCGVNPPSRWGRSGRSKPPWPPDTTSIADQFLGFLDLVGQERSGLVDRLSRLSQHTALSDELVPARWSEYISQAAGRFREAIGEWTRDISQLRDAYNEVPVEPRANASREMSKAHAIHYMIQALCEITVIEWLADRRFLPRYGFPINLQSLSVRKVIDTRHGVSSAPDERYRLERSSLLALREYVPGSRVLVGGRVATSRGLRKHWTDSNVDKALGLQYFSLDCPEGHVYIRQSPDEVCPKCGGAPVSRRELVFPRFGYTTAAWGKMPLGTNLERVGEQSACPTAFAERGGDMVVEGFGGAREARVVYREEAELLVTNVGDVKCGFAICTRCGFAASETARGQGRIDLPRDFDKHASVFSTDPTDFCWKKNEQSAPVLRNKVLAARELTDMAELQWPGATVLTHDAAYSLGRALMLAGARLLELDERELGVQIVPLRDGKLGITVYDTAPGGAGHCRGLIDRGEDWIRATRQILYVDENHHSRCERACLECILDFSGQHSAARLDRRSALTLLDNATC